MRMFGIFIILICVGFSAQAKKGQLILSVEREQPLDSSFTPILVIHASGQSLFGEQSKITEKTVANAPLYFLLNSRSEKSSFEESLPLGKYEFQIVLKKKMTNCSVSGTKASGFCLAEESDIACLGAAFEITEGKVTEEKVTCRAGNELRP